MFRNYENQHKFVTYIDSGSKFEFKIDFFFTRACNVGMYEVICGMSLPSVDGVAIA